MTTAPVATEAEAYGIWCFGEGWVQLSNGYIFGPRDVVEADLPSWQSGEAANVDPKDFTYEIRRYP